jgi:ankyrin repeat protein
MVVTEKGSRNDHLITAADRFIWVFCQLEVLRRALPAHLRRALKDMPKTLYETYERALLEIDEEKRQYAQRLFQCLAVSIRPLRVEELASILKVQFNAGALPNFNPNSIWPLPADGAEEAVLSMCSYLINIIDIDGSRVVQFSHFSVKEFLTSDRLADAGEDLSGYHIVPHLAHSVLAQASLSVLLQLDATIDKDSIKKFPLSGYAAKYWVNHGQFENVSSTIQVAMERLFNPDKPYFSAWVWMYDIDDSWKPKMPTSHPKRPQAAPLYYAILCGFRGLIEHLVATYPRDVNARGGYYETPLLAAFIQNDIGTASLLLKRGANVLDKRHVAPLHRASQGGRVDFLQLLLDHGADVNLRDSADITPLGWASRAGEIETSRLLLQRGANANFQNALGSSALQSAVRRGHLDVALLIIKSGAHIDIHATDGWTPLHVALEEGHDKLVELLIQHGANVGSRSKGGHTPLHLAALNGKLDIVKLLVGRGADPNICNGKNQKPLDLASDNKKLEVANFLSPLTTSLGGAVEPSASSLNSRSQPNVKPNVVERPKPRGKDVKHSQNERPSMHTASKYGQIEVVRSLLDHGSDIDERDASQWTALAVASMNGKLEVAKLLIERGANVNTRGEFGWTSLHFASRNGHLDVVRLLLNHGGDLNARQRSRRTALDLTSCYGHLEIAKLLLKSGANANVRNDYGLTPKNKP